MPNCAAIDLIRRVDWTIGESAPAFYYNMYRFKEGIPSWGEALVLTRDENQTDELIRELQTELDREFPWRPDHRARNRPGAARSRPLWK